MQAQQQQQLLLLQRQQQQQQSAGAAADADTLAEQDSHPLQEQVVDLARQLQVRLWCCLAACAVCCFLHQHAMMAQHLSVCRPARLGLLHCWFLTLHYASSLPLIHLMNHVAFIAKSGCNH
jgi:hypothetical protein